MKTPKYLQIKIDLLKEIKSGKFASGDKFYSEKELIEKYEVSSITVIRAIQELTSEGFLIRKQGKGTYISRSRKRKLVEFSDIEVFPQKNDQVTVVSLTKENNLEILQKLNLLPQNDYYKIIRLRSNKDEPYFVQTSYIPSDYIKKDKIKDLTYYQSIYQRFKTDFKIVMSDQDSIEINEICMDTPQEFLTLLKLEDNKASVHQSKITTLRNTSHVLEYVVSYKKLNYYKIEFATVEINQS